MGMKFTNFATSTLASGITNVATSLTVFAGDGGKFPTLGAGDYFYAVLENLAGTREIIKVTARTGDSFGTVVRGQDGTTNLAWNAGDKIELRVVNANVSDFPKLDEANTFSGPASTFTNPPVMSSPLAVASGGTNATTAATARSSLGAAASGANGDITSLTNATGIAVHGTNTNDSAAAGYVGEYVTATLLSGASTALSTGTAANIVSISLTAGDWDISGSIGFTGNAATTLTTLIGSISTTSATQDTDPKHYFQTVPVSNSLASVGQLVFALPTSRLSLSTTTTVYLVATAVFATNTLGGYGFIGARRIR